MSPGSPLDWAGNCRCRTAGPQGQLDSVHPIEIPGAGSIVEGAGDWGFGVITGVLKPDSASNRVVHS